MASATIAAPATNHFPTVQQSGMATRFASKKTAGVRTVYVTGDSGKEYVVQFVRRAGMRRESCSCPDFIFRGSTKRTHKSCKHIRLARAERHNEIVRRRNARIEAEMEMDRLELDAAPSASEMTREMLEREFIRVTGL
jgi:predicted nucleic acid-binding Zn finger protein